MPFDEIDDIDLELELEIDDSSAVVNNIVEETVVPDMPTAQFGQQVYVHIPIGGHTVKGIVSFSDDFIVRNGHVALNDYKNEHYYKHSFKKSDWAQVLNSSFFKLRIPAATHGMVKPYVSEYYMQVDEDGTSQIKSAIPKIRVEIDNTLCIVVQYEPYDGFLVIKDKES